MGQSIRQSMPSNAHYAFMQRGLGDLYSPQTRAYPSKSHTYPYTIGVWIVRKVWIVALPNPA